MARSTVIGGMCLILLGSAAGLKGQDRALAEMYGRGVHAYYNQQYEAAHAQLTKAVDKGCVDPRVYFFRGLAAGQLGRMEDAHKDFAHGARLEANAPEPIYGVSNSLLRIQGPLRLAIEDSRKQARKDKAQLQQRRQQARYERLTRAEALVLFDPSKPPPQSDVELPEDAQNDPKDPFRSGFAFSGGQGTAVQDTGGDDTGGGPVRDPFANVNPPTENTAPENPFANPPKTPDNENPFQAAPDNPAEVRNPFGAENTPPANTPPVDAEKNPFEAEPGDEVPRVDPPTPPSAGGAVGTVLNILGNLNKNAADPFAEGSGDNPMPPGGNQNNNQPERDPFK